MAVRSSTPHGRRTVLQSDAQTSGSASAEPYWADLLIEETPVPISDFSAAAELLAQQARQQLDRLLPAADSPAGRFLARIRWLASALPDLQLRALDSAELEGLLPKLCQGLRSLDELHAVDWLSLLQAEIGYHRLAEIDRLAPPELELPNGNRHALSYDDGKSPVLAVRLQELFGVAETPRVAGGRIPVCCICSAPIDVPSR